MKNFQKGSTLVGIIIIIIAAIVLIGGYLGYQYYKDKETDAMDQNTELLDLENAGSEDEIDSE